MLGTTGHWLRTSLSNFRSLVSASYNRMRTIGERVGSWRAPLLFVTIIFLLSCTVLLTPGEISSRQWKQAAIPIVPPNQSHVIHREAGNTYEVIFIFIVVVVILSVCILFLWILFRNYRVITTRNITLAQYLARGHLADHNFHARLRMALLNRDFNGDDYEMLQQLDDIQQSRGATETAINRMPLHNIDAREISSRIETGTGQCCICLAQFEEGDSMRTMICLHQFHKECVDQWLRQNAICPICKIPISQA